MKLNSINDNIYSAPAEKPSAQLSNAVCNDHFHKVKLTQREIECLNLVAHGSTMKMIARKLDISPRTVEQHLRNIKEKFEVNTKSQLVELWYGQFSM